jgi:glutathione S-transferase
MNKLHRLNTSAHADEMSFSLPQDYGYVFATLGGSFFMNMYLTFNVISARKKYGVEYPALYAPTGHKFEKEFNSVQRAHQNTLESYGIVMLQMCACGLVYPITSAAFGAVWVLGRFIYGFGYANFGPKGRMVGGILGHFGDFPLVIMTLKIAYDMIVK